MGHVRAGEFSQFHFCHALPIPGDNKSMRRLAPFFVRHSDDGHFLHGRMRKQNALDFHGRNVFAAADDYIHP
jgi:hypothetical protein